ncbi:hypothetical protein VIBNISOn1_1640008 [Vibrio nigripulchritudo SOn1]|uniref:Uncharacterized protein n=1 Tax=Vibrio nigripulchritudo SOn1 TaxID=1238450 RepID=A0AAV2VNJ4_9VIBR|nr:hypothetical protein VIBNISOn1_1640008 [Vibrio nigripulchritudo SOn1]
MVGEEGTDATGLPAPDPNASRIQTSPKRKKLRQMTKLSKVVGEEGFDATGLPAPDPNASRIHTSPK